ncbi:MAG: chemotaxis protein CheC [Deltaproteobacteria bacterium]
MKDEMDILREVGSIAVGHGSIALSEILGRKINVQMPSLELVSADDMLKKINSAQLSTCVSCNILSGLKGEILFVLEEKSAFRLIDSCFPQHFDENRGSVFTEMGLSVIKEIGNVIISSYVGALSMILKTIVIISIPTLVNGSIQQIMTLTMGAYRKEEAILIAEAIFDEPSANIKGSFYLVLNNEAVKYIQEACKRLLEQVKEGEE